MNQPWIKITYDNGFDDKVTIRQTMKGNTVDDVMMAIRYALLGMGFSEELIKEYFEGGDSEKRIADLSKLLSDTLEAQEIQEQ